ncbi:LOW QUALITY PROTEIN: uncharacterized protein LOC133836694 [Drosophila sulfurigaster albostrigata]|uniref:LOW QUALITY PROTEIN: uncharacterized protein LOC133836694 n=1 Tax=Drosophila sulfurigaster albostrigata TaxID=89887 RepID=UPI002D21DAAB|nr:LOW QUALITY PROTEIN: uncharacterized protein LOC133836694 [Drosophila sulfurigaster albostrigata]
MLQQCIIKSPNGALGLNLSRAPWDPYPWVSGVQAESNAQLAGVRIGDTLLQLNGIDVLGMRISELANRLREHWLTGAEHATMMMWRQQPATLSSTDDPNEAAHAVQHGINQQSLQKFATCLQHIAQLLECPVCCDVVKPPGWQCCNGHVLCNNCRNRSVKCPVCRVPLGPRGRCLLSDKLFTLLAENFPCDGEGLLGIVHCVQDFRFYKFMNSIVHMCCLILINSSQHTHTHMYAWKIKFVYFFRLLVLCFAVKINKENDNSNSNSRSIENSNAKCTNEYHNQPKMALAKSNSNSSKKSRKTSRQQQLQEDTLILVVNGAGAGEEQAKTMLGEEKEEVKQCVKQVSGMPKGNEQSAQILRNNVNDAGLQCGVIKAQQQAGNSTKELQPVMEAVESNNMLVKPKLKLSKKSWQITGRDQDELRCDEVANINNGQQRMLGLELHSGQQQSEVEGQVLLLVEAEAKKKEVEEEEQSTGQQQYQNYHCPTGKSCCSQAKLFQPASANKLSTVKRESATVTATAAPEKRLGAVAEIAFVVATAAAAKTVRRPYRRTATKRLPRRMLRNWYGGASIKMLLNLQPCNVALEPLNVVHFDGTFGQRLRVHAQLRPQQTQVCLRLSEEPSSGSREVQTFFLALLPWQDKHAVFLWHLNAAEQEPAQHFQTVIEAQGNRVKWFGQAQPVTRSWPEICAAGQFLTWMDEGQQSCTAFDIIVKRK